MKRKKLNKVLNILSPYAPTVVSDFVLKDKRKLTKATFEKRTKELSDQVTARISELKKLIPSSNPQEVVKYIKELYTLQVNMEGLSARLSLLQQSIPKQVSFDKEFKIIEGRLETLEGKDTADIYATIQEVRDELEKSRKELLNILNNRGGGNMNRAMYVGGSNPLTRYTDINLKAGSNVTLATSTNNTTKFTDITISSSGGGGGGGIVRSINSISADTPAGSTSGTDYVYLVSGSTTLTLPDATLNTNLYTVKNVGNGTVTVATTSAQTIDGSISISLPVKYTAVDLESDGTNWNVT